MWDFKVLVMIIIFVIPLLRIKRQIRKVEICSNLNKVKKERIVIIGDNQKTKDLCLYLLLTFLFTKQKKEKGANGANKNENSVNLYNITNPFCPNKIKFDVLKLRSVITINRSINKFLTHQSKEKFHLIFSSYKHKLIINHQV